MAWMHSISTLEILCPQWRLADPLMTCFISNLTPIFSRFLPITWPKASEIRAISTDWAAGWAAGWTALFCGAGFSSANSEEIAKRLRKERVLNMFFHGFSQVNSTLKLAFFVF